MVSSPIFSGIGHLWNSDKTTPAIEPLFRGEVSESDRVTDSTITARAIDAHPI
jgi:hypothetical protein